MRPGQRLHSPLADSAGGCEVDLPGIGRRSVLGHRRLRRGPGTRNTGCDGATPRHNIAKGHLTTLSAEREPPNQALHLPGEHDVSTMSASKVASVTSFEAFFTSCASRYAQPVLKLLSVPAGNDRTPRFMEKALGAIHQS